MMKNLCAMGCKASGYADKIGFPILQLTSRLWMANLFFKSGWNKFENYLDGNWDNTLLLFEEIHPVPLVPYEMAAVMGTGGEVVLPILLALGLGGRFAALGLFIMTLVIQFGVPAEYGIANNSHYIWMMLLAIPLTKGSGLISIDYLIGRFFCKKAK